MRKKKKKRERGGDKKSERICGILRDRGRERERNE